MSKVAGGIPLGELFVMAAQTNVGKFIAPTSSRDKIEQHLVNQRARSISDTHRGCMYRGSRGLMCAVGCLIPDELYHPRLEAKTVYELDFYNEAHVLPQDISVNELGLWQSYHDSSADLGQFGEWGYTQWLNGYEEKHPANFKAALAQYLETKKK